MALQPVPLFPLGAGLFPDGLLALRIFEVRYLDMVKRALKEKTGFGVILLSEGSEVRAPDKTERFHSVGTMAEIVDADALQPALLLKGGNKLAQAVRGGLQVWGNGNDRVISNGHHIAHPKPILRLMAGLNAKPFAALAAQKKEGWLKSIGIHNFGHGTYGMKPLGFVGGANLRALT